MAKQGHVMRQRFISATSPVLIALLLAVTTAPAWADLYSAKVAYKKGDYATAFGQFKELAELGQPQAQYDLAVMYARGEGVKSSNVYAHAWASLAGQNGDAKGKALAEQLEPDLTPTSLRISSEIRAQYDQASLNIRLMPHLLEGKEYADRDPVRRDKPYMPTYPKEALQGGIQGDVYVEFVVAPDGHPRIPRILYALPSGFFETAVRESVMRSTYLPARISGRPIGTSASVMYNFTLDSASIHDYVGLEKLVSNTKSKAENGDPQAQMLFGMMIAGLPQLNGNYSQALPWFLKAAQAGAPYAQYQIGTGLLQGRGCQCETGKGEIWLLKAAQADQSDAQVSLAEYLLRDDSNHESVAGALVWLERASKQNNSAAKLLLSAVLASSPLNDVRDPPRALMLTEGIEREYKIDPSFWEIRAAANAARGDFKAAVKAQSKAVSEATHLNWDLSQLHQRQSLYESARPWTGNLLAF
jgi:TonB family protein